MSDFETKSARYRLGVFAFVVLTLSALSFHGALDNIARGHADDATTEALLVYGTVRALNMGVSVLQNSELGIGIGTVEIGQLLDPINDAAERASTALAWSIGSLFVQRIFLGVASSNVVQWVFVTSGLLALLACLPLASIVGVSANTLDSARRATVRWFAIAGMFRFLVPAFVASSYLASEAFLQETLEEERAAVSEITKTIDILNLSDSVNDEERAEGLRNQIEGLREERASIEERFVVVNEDIDGMDKPLRCTLTLMRLGCPPELDSLREERDRLTDEIEAVDLRTGTAQSELECIEDGTSCGGLISGLLSQALEILGNPRERVRVFREWVRDLPERLTYLMVSLLVKCIVFPILFLLLASKLGGYVAKRMVSLQLHVPARNS